MQVFKFIKDQELVRLLKDGTVGVLPTDTIYGLVCQAADKLAVKRLYDLKSREHKPGTVIAASINQLVELGIKYRYLKAVETFWPNPISVIIPCGEELSYLHHGLKGLAIRIPAGKELSQLLDQTGPLLTTSANLSNKPIASTIAETQKIFGDEVGFYVDGGDLSNHQPSTIIRIIDDAIEVVREGAVKIGETGKIEP